MSSQSSPLPITPVPAPWTLKGTIYSFVFYISSSSTSNLPAGIFSPLEASSVFASGKPKGGLGMIQVIRHSESPVGPYDELLLAPGAFEYESRDVDSKGKKIKKTNLTVTRIYVSRKETCWNGRKNWNIPKHLARFEFNALSTGCTEIKVFLHDTTSDATESVPSSTPFFIGIYKPISYLPYFPASTKAAKYVGMNLNIVQPPLPEGRGSLGELPGTDRWCKVLPLEYTQKASFGWWDLRQDEGEGRRAVEDDAAVGRDRDAQLSTSGSSEDANTDSDNWASWLGSGRWRLGVKMDNATIEFEAGEFWE